MNDTDPGCGRMESAAASGDFIFANNRLMLKWFFINFSYAFNSKLVYCRGKKSAPFVEFSS